MVTKASSYNGTANLIPIRTHEEAVEKGRRGAYARAEAIKKRKTLKEELLVLLSENNNQNNMTLALIQKALNGDIKAFEVIRDTIGEKQTEKIEATITDKLEDLL